MTIDRKPEAWEYRDSSTKRTAHMAVRYQSFSVLRGLGLSPFRWLNIAYKAAQQVAHDVSKKQTGEADLFGCVKIELDKL